MKSLTNIVTAFAKGITHSRVSLIGAMIVTVIFPFLLGAIFYDLIWHIQNTYVAALIYMVLGPAFITGLVMVFLGLFFFKGQEEVRLFTMEYLRDYFTDPAKFSKLRKLVFFAVFLTGINLFIMGLLAYRGYHYMESNAFCGQFCHTVMSPEYTAYQNSPHSRVACVECHIGAGADWFVKSKITGAYQLLAVMLDTFPRPIPTPLHDLRPATETCAECHRPEKFHGNRLVVNDHFDEDEENTHRKNVLLMKIGSAGDRTTSPHGIHWHVSEDNLITYKASPDRTVIPEVTLHRPDGTKVIYRTPDADEVLAEIGADVVERTMDCIDCHNRPTHIYKKPGPALDRKMLEGVISQELPYIKRQAMEVIQRDYASHDEARNAIANELNTWYKKNYPDFIAANPGKLEQAIAGVQAAYLENVFPEMNITWGTYVDHIAHTEDFDFQNGCIRCHNDMHEAETGEFISMDCTICHEVLAQDEVRPQVLKDLGFY
ncbi:NapC/NirT cytochrome c family, N-terminal region [Geoalkalibacter ferrihydriticus]|uniref:NapC/NirT cytochrome c family, N-terminal region n=1 Tax=Geoalkalibacter ferrihydriticus TaxID=392333 RepID=A0A1G9MA35_9BACT|nr:NapC/NirT family cytochrome c [Geoalkalibacter ferrihydriticus]SDL71126.1 NapC/NirT cytochrome c family, N-terminal region [Geoalkalibacter ferrihydriticus]